MVENVSNNIKDEVCDLYFTINSILASYAEEKVFVGWWLVIFTHYFGDA